ncbi:hypothetical protein GJAV_G00239370 [Gymnothorax javanicus]|nr:hypothetical protein GJAV_G00239370 [Gymnothorax javanicus]
MCGGGTMWGEALGTRGKLSRPYASSSALHSPGLSNEGSEPIEESALFHSVKAERRPREVVPSGVHIPLPVRLMHPLAVPCMWIETQLLIPSRSGDRRGAFP